MRKIYIDIEDMSDSREVYMSRPNPWITSFVYSLVAIIIFIVFFLCVAKIDIYTTANGVIRPNDEVGEVVPLVGGKVIEVSFYDGQYVNEGDILFTVDISEVELKMAEMIASEKKYLFEQQMLQEYLEAIESGVNPFDSYINGDEYKYYLSYLDYSLNLENSKQKYMYDRGTNDANLQNYSNRLAQIDYELAGLDAYKNSIENGQNLCGNYPIYNALYLEYMANSDALTNGYKADINSITSDTTTSSGRVYIDYYRTQINGYDTLISSISDGVDRFTEEESSYKLMFENYLREIAGYEKLYKDDYSALGAAIETYKNNMLSSYMQARDELKAKADNLELQIAGVQDINSQINECNYEYNSQVNLNYLGTISKIETQIEALKNERHSVEASVKLFSLAEEKYNNLVGEDGTPVEVSLYEIETSLNILSGIEECTANLDSIKADIAIAQEQMDRGTVTASKSGFVNMVNIPVVGNVVGAGEVVATIIPANESGYRVLMYLNNSEIAKIHTGETIKYNISALPQNKYGIVEGNIVSVSYDTIWNKGDYTGYYLVEGSISDDILYDYEGNEGKIGIGMEVTAKIVTERKTIARYLLEKIDIF